MSRSQAVAFAEYATAQVAYHREDLALHQPDGTGCCQRCGRIWPCSHVVHSRQMAAHFSPWALDDEHCGPVRRPDLVRPYLKHAGDD